jgi:hypothetical protein
MIHWTSLIRLLALMTVAAAGRAAEYDIGPGQPLSRIGQVAMHDLQAGDTVRIHWRAEPYREKFRISGEGTAAQPIRVVGVPGPNGERPVIDGENATTHPGDVWPKFVSGGVEQSIGDLGLVMVFRGPTRDYGYKPKHIEISGLEIRHGRKTYTFTDAEGSVRRFGGSGIWMLGCEDVSIINCKIHDCGDGLFAKSNGEEATATRRIRIARCHIENNSEIPPPPPAFEFASHNVYTECFGVIFEDNYFGPTRPGSNGGNLKDRSTGTVIRNNWIEGGLRLIDLVEAQDAWPMAQNDPAYRRAHVYGNYLVSGPGQAATAVHYGGDSGSANTYRKGRLDFHHNTVVFRRDQSELYRVRVFEITSNDEELVAWNNIFYREAATRGATPTLLYLGLSEGRHNFGTNWVSPGWGPWDNGIQGIGTMNGLEKLVSPGGENPGFINAAAKDYRLGAYSPIRNLGEALPAEAPAVTSQYVFHGRSELRPNAGAPDPGANEFVPPAGPVAPEAHPQNLAVVQNRPLPVRLTGYDGNGDPLNFAVVTPPASGSLSGTAPELTYTPGPDFLGVDSFSFVAFDAGLTSAPVTVSLTVDRPRYLLTVQGGTGSGSYVAGTVVNLTIAEPPAGQQFISWAGAAVADNQAASTSLVMPSSDTTVAALFRPVAPAGGPFTYEVGPGRPYPTLSSVPWTRLFPGDTVRVHWRPEPYAEKVLIPGRGTATAPIRFEGVRGPNNQRPIISGLNAVTGTNTAFASWDISQYLGLITVARADGDSQFFKPGHIRISGLELRDVQPTPNGVTPIIWFDAAAIRLDGAEQVRIEDCDVHDVPTGVQARLNGGEFGLTRDLVIERCHFHRVGVVGSYSGANLNTEVAGLTVRFCRLDPLLEGSFGDNVLDRSAGTVFEANRIEGAARMLELAAPIGEAGNLIRNDPRFNLTRVVGNLILVTHREASQPVFCGADLSDPDRPRTGTLEMFHNTVLIRSGAYEVRVPSVGTPITVDFRGNIIHRAGDERIQLLGYRGTLNSGVNWVSPGWLPGSPAVINGTANIIGAANNDPGLDAAYRPQAGSPCRDTAPEPLLSVQYRDIANGQLRGVIGTAADLGAFEGGLAEPGPTATLTSGLGGNALQLRLGGTPSAAYRVLWSPDLATWQPLGIYTLPVTGELELPSPTTAAAQGFFRVE